VFTGQNALSLDALNPFSARLNKILVFAKGGNDTIQLGGGKQNIPLTIGPLGPPVETRIDAGAGNDTIYGSSGRDTVFGGIGNDTIYGAAGDDSLYGQAGLDQIFGGLDNDLLDGGADFLADILRGEEGDDTFVRYTRLDGLFASFELENTDFNASGTDHFTMTTIRRVTRTGVVLDPVRV
jgi:Ca2+-binding RTX toxin-like protein